MYDAADVPGDYAGNGFELRSSDLKPILVRPSEAIIDSGALPFDFTITERADPNCVSSDEIDSFSSSFGAYFGMFSNDSGSGCVSSGSVVAYLSADKTVLLAVLCTSITQFPANCQAYLVGKS